ncbi:helix-turn-helix transcriptional regulator [Shewanella sp. 202IG2-18]|uniref:helix-turn-helix domain-containing protein n=1 Tax=Parashewanella hymeniacidonis TaxID=2807618 RepID=UPI0019604BE7|nr:helix-turn-helix transcriptional regulator [Parashewanella hymeniacidonis]MBM7070749.1 helix-turn-helix transcriptional regulator [Parashewanella hymeniacidonis]
MTFGERLDYTLRTLHINQSELSRRSGVAQQTINYIIQRKLHKSKFAYQLADALNVNPTWLVHGFGRFESSFSRDTPIIRSYVDLQTFLRQGQLPNHNKYLIVEQDLGESCFAFQTDLTEVIICTNQDTFGAKEFLKIEPLQIEIVINPGSNTYPIYEIRRRCNEF